jgi:hypothetical protein
MDAERFDDLTRWFLTGASRRWLLGGLTSGVLAGLSVHKRGGAAEKRKPYVGGSCKPKGRKCPAGSHCTRGCTHCSKRSKRKRCECQSGLTLCGVSNTPSATCVDLSVSASHCGACEINCLAIAGSATCLNGRCCMANGSECGSSCGRWAPCDLCCTGSCRLDGTCGPIADCVSNGESCPSACALDAPCPDCCGGICDEDGACTSDCVPYGGSCTDSAECCDGVPCTLGRCRYP